MGQEKDHHDSEHDQTVEDGGEGIDPELLESLEIGAEEGIDLEYALHDAKNEQGLELHATVAKDESCRQHEKRVNDAQGDLKPQKAGEQLAQHFRFGGKGHSRVLHDAHVGDGQKQESE